MSADISFHIEIRKKGETDTDGYSDPDGVGVVSG